MFWLAIFGSLLGYTAYTYLLKNVRPALATSYAYVNPALAVLLGVWIGGEHFPKMGMVAMPFILAGVVMVIIGPEEVRRVGMRSSESEMRNVKMNRSGAGRSVIV